MPSGGARSVTQYCAKSPTGSKTRLFPAPALWGQKQLQEGPGPAYRSAGAGGEDGPREHRTQHPRQQAPPSITGPGALPAGQGRSQQLQPSPAPCSVGSWAHVVIGRLRSRFLQAMRAQMAWDRLAVSVFRWLWRLQDTEQEGPRRRPGLRKTEGPSSALPRATALGRESCQEHPMGLYCQGGGLSPGRAMERSGRATLAAVQGPPCSGETAARLGTAEPTPSSPSALAGLLPGNAERQLRRGLGVSLVGGSGQRRSKRFDSGTTEPENRMGSSTPPGSAEQSLPASHL